MRDVTEEEEGMKYNIKGENVQGKKEEIKSVRAGEGWDYDLDGERWQS
jgi:hypothetical protein